MTEWESIEETSAGRCPLCGEEMVKHIIKEGARYHVYSYFLCMDQFGNFAKTTYSTKNCEDNHGYGRCVPRKEAPKRMPPELLRVKFL